MMPSRNPELPLGVWHENRQYLVICGYSGEAMESMPLLGASYPVLDELQSGCCHGRGTWASALLALSLTSSMSAGERTRRRIERMGCDFKLYVCVPICSRRRDFCCSRPQLVVSTTIPTALCR